MRDHGVGSEVLSILTFGPAVVFVSYFAFRPPAPVVELMAASAAVRVSAVILCATLVAYGCRRVVQALLRLGGFR